MTGNDVRTKLAAAHLCMKEVADFCGEIAAGNTQSKTVAKLEFLALDCKKICNQISIVRNGLLKEIEDEKE